MKYFSRKNKKPNNIYRVILQYKFKSCIILVVSLIQAFLETTGLVMILPLLAYVIKGNVSPKIEKILNVFFYYIPFQNKLIGILVIIFLITILKTILTIYSSYLSANFSFSLGEKWKNQLMNSYLLLPKLKLSETNFGSLINNLMSETNNGSKCINAYLNLISQMALCTFMYISLFFINLKVTIAISVFGFIIYLAISNPFKKLAIKLGEKRIKASQDLSEVTSESIIGNHFIKTYIVQNIVFERFKKLTRNFKKIAISFRIFNVLPTNLTELSFVLFFIILLGVLTGFNIDSLREQFAVVGTVIIIGIRLFPKLTNLFVQWNSVHNQTTSVDLVYRMLDRRDQLEKLDDGLLFNTFEKEIAFNNISFAYGENQVLKDLSFPIEKNKTTAIVGYSGCGKTTIADLLLRIYDLSSGSILVDGLPINNYSLKSWRGKIGYVSQNIFLFNTSIIENIRMGKPDATDEEIMEVCKKIQIHDFISGFPEGYESVVGDQGSRLSGGQKQRIAIARAILRDPEIYIFDEATSALDNSAEKVIQDAIEKLKGKTIVIIAHRLSTIENADVVYDIGKINKL